ncbi:unnamed protein product [Rotaria sp. Silwood1]|nr:unnamed protein product [Rotaria sp. Silwood1]CAF5130911.1 unnamed protein product [Rotaria sp. Silwood1]
MVVNFNLCGQKFMGLNGGPMFKFNPSISIFIFCKTQADVEKIWNTLSTDGMTFMPLNEYPWSKKYGWCSDKFGLSWQIMLDESLIENQKIVPSLMFANAQAGKAVQAIDLYTSLFDSSEVVLMDKYGVNENQPEGNIKYSRFTLNNKEFSVMDNAMPFEHNFNEAISFVIECETQAEIDFYWAKLIANGGQESRCGWLKDKFGVSWQVVPKVLGKLMTDPEKAPRIVQAFMKMNKFNIEDLLNA